MSDTSFVFNFERLEVWQRAIAFADLIYSQTRTFPDTERFGLVTQMRRAAVSISSNIAEGASRSSRLDFIRYLEISSGSVFETVSQGTIAKRQKFITEPDYDRLKAAAQELIRMLSGLRKSLQPTSTSRTPAK